MFFNGRASGRAWITFQDSLAASKALALDDTGLSVLTLPPVCLMPVEKGARRHPLPAHVLHLKSAASVLDASALACSLDASALACSPLACSLDASPLACSPLACSL